MTNHEHEAGGAGEAVPVQDPAELGASIRGKVREIMDLWSHMAAVREEIGHFKGIGDVQRGLPDTTDPVELVERNRTWRTINSELEARSRDFAHHVGQLDAMVGEVSASVELLVAGCIEAVAEGAADQAARGLAGGDQG